jgi:hypothetical protein
MKATKISTDSLFKLFESLSEDQKKILKEGLKQLEETDPEKLSEMLSSDDSIVLFACEGGSPEPGLERW